MARNNLTRTDRITNQDDFVLFSGQEQDYRGITVPKFTQSLIDLGFQHSDPTEEEVLPAGFLRFAQGKT